MPPTISPLKVAGHCLRGPRGGEASRQGLPLQSLCATMINTQNKCLQATTLQAIALESSANQFVGTGLCGHYRDGRRGRAGWPVSCRVQCCAFFVGMALALQQAKRQTVFCGYWPCVKMGTSAARTKTCTSRLLPGSCLNLEQAGRAATHVCCSCLAPPPEPFPFHRTSITSVKNLLRRAPAEVSPDYAVKLDMIKAGEQVEDMPFYNPRKLRGILKLNDALLAKGMLVINPSLEQEIRWWWWLAQALPPPLPPQQATG